jgi:cytochrome c oxidase assembly protein subunit 16
MFKKNNKLLKNFLPFGVITFGIYIGLAQFRELNYKFRKNEPGNVFQEQLTQVGMDKDSYQARSSTSLEDEYKKFAGKLDIDSWKNIRGPRPWENSREYQESIRKGAIQKSENDKAK